MLQALLITFREGLEAFLIVGVILVYLRKRENGDLIRAVRVGIAASIATCLVGAWLWIQVPNQPLYEGIAALTAALFVGALLWQATRVGRQIKGNIEARIGRAARAGGAGSSRRATIAVAAATTLLITREGLEAVFFLGVQAMASNAAMDRAEGALVLAGAVLGLVLAAMIAWYWTRFAGRLNLALVLKVSALFLALFLVQLLVYGVHELAESGVIHGSQAFHDATEIFGPDGQIGHLLSYSLFGAPLLYLIGARRIARAAVKRDLTAGVRAA